MNGICIAELPLRWMNSLYLLYSEELDLLLVVEKVSLSIIDDLASILLIFKLNYPPFYFYTLGNIIIHGEHQTIYL